MKSQNWKSTNSENQWVWSIYSIVSVLFSLILVTGIACTASPNSDAAKINVSTNGPQSETIKTSSEEFPVEIVDDSGEIITIPRAPSRVIALLPSVTDLIADVGLSNRIIATDDFSTLSLEYMDLPTVGGKDFIFNLEAMVDLSPDLIVTASSGTSELVTQLRLIGIPVVVLDFPADVSEMLSALRKIGVIFGSSGQAERLATKLENRLADITSKIVRQKPVRVYLEIDQSTPTQPFTVSKGSLHHEVLTLAGGENIFGESMGAFPQVNWESIIQGDPEVILLLDSSEYNLDSTPNLASFTEVSSRTGWEGIQAVKNNAVIPFPPDLFNGGIEIIDAVERIAAILEEHSNQLIQKENNR